MRRIEIKGLFFNVCNKLKSLTLVRSAVSRQKSHFVSSLLLGVENRKSLMVSIEIKTPYIKEKISSQEYI